MKLNLNQIKFSTELMLLRYLYKYPRQELIESRVFQLGNYPKSALYFQDYKFCVLFGLQAKRYHRNLGNVGGGRNFVVGIISGGGNVGAVDFFGTENRKNHTQYDERIQNFGKDAVLYVT